MQSVSKTLFKKSLAQQTLFRSSQAFFSGKDIRFGNEARRLMLKGCDDLADAVQVTLGPRGRNVILDQTFGNPKITKDGVTVAKAIEFQDRYHNMGASLVKQVASQTNDKAGDGTTTATILARAIFKEGCKSVAAGLNPMDLRKGIQLAVNAIVANIKDMAIPVSGKESIENVASISANNDRHIGGLIAAIFEKIGKEGTITVQDGKTLDVEVDYVEGLKFDRGYISPYFVTDTKNSKVEMENALILLVDKKVSTIQQILKHLEHASQLKRPILIVAEDVESEALATLVINKLRGGLRVCAVKSPGFGDNRKATMQDIAISTGATLISEEIGLSLDTSEVDVLGSAKKIIITKDDTIILDGQGEKAALEDRIDVIKQLIEKTTSDYEREKAQERLGKLTGGVAVIKVGGSSEVEVSELKDRIDDALCATRAAIDEGIVPGGGVALLSSSKVLDGVKGDNFDQDIGIKIVRQACMIPCKIICQNAGFEGSVIVDKLLNSDNVNYGFDAAKGEFTDLIVRGVMDPAKVVRTALVDSAGIASLMITTEAMVVEKKDTSGLDASGNPGGVGGGPPGMGGMGGMGGMF
jgi:chaperonin GroEL